MELDGIAYMPIVLLLITEKDNGIIPIVMTDFLIVR